MEAKFYQEGEITIVALRGRLEIEKTAAFKTACLQSLKGRKIVFCMKELSFVGSTGIQGFFQIIRELNESRHFTAKISDLKPDFLRLIPFGNGTGLEFCENQAGAVMSFQTPALAIS